jgi:DNA-binding response OmpR family regulator
MKPASTVKLLVVEDDPFFLRVLHKRLATEGYQVLTAADGREGMKAIVSAEPDLVISDWMMPEVDGLELCQSVKTGLREAAPYFILLTAKGEINDRLLGLETGADDYLVKPCDQGELMARVRAGLRIVLLTQDLRRVVSELRATNADLAAARAEVTRLNDLTPICSFCKKVRSPDGEWGPLDHYLGSHERVDFTHGLCPTCRDAHDPLRTGEPRS